MKRSIGSILKEITAVSQIETAKTKRNGDPRSQDRLDDQLDGREIKGSGSSSSTLWAIEARAHSTIAQKAITLGIDGAGHPLTHTLSLQWSWVHFPLLSNGGTLYGVPIRQWDREAAQSGLYSIEAALALRAGLMAALAYDHGDLCVQTRLVKVEWQESHSYREVGIVYEEEDYGQYRRKFHNAPVTPRFPAEPAAA